ncbi:MAG: XdhC family protein, partial [Eubacterium sp.]
GATELMAAKDAVECIGRGENAIKDYALNAKNGMVCGGDLSVFIEVTNTRPQLLLCGAGHVGKALMKVAHLAGFDITLVDTRDETQISDAILEADTFIPLNDFYEGLMALDCAPGAFIVIATYGHHFDKEALAAALTKKAAYVGMIGSRKKVGVIFEKLGEDGFSDEQLRSVYAPIGMDIGGETPEEIAFSIISEILAVKYNKSGGHLSDHSS